jgi:hypothetical protein
MAAKLLTVGKGGVCAYRSTWETCSGYVGHDWTGEVGPDTVAIDSRGVAVDVHCKLAIGGPMVDVGLPPGTMSRPFEDGVRPYQGAARSLDYVALDVYTRLYEQAGAAVYRGEDAAEFVRSAL